MILKNVLSEVVKATSFFLILADHPGYLKGGQLGYLLAIQQCVRTLPFRVFCTE